MMTSLTATTATHKTMTTPAAARTIATRIVLSGFMGAGKSTVGRMLAERLGYTFLDIDAEIERSSGRTVSQIFAESGESAFRKLESSAIAHALGAAKVIIGLGGGALESLTNRLLLEQTADTAIVFLDAPFEVLFDRCVLQEGAAVRPILLDAAAASERFRARAPHYRRIATLRVATETQTAAETVAEILSRLLNA